MCGVCGVCVCVCERVRKREGQRKVLSGRKGGGGRNGERDVPTFILYLFCLFRVTESIANHHVVSKSRRSRNVPVS